MRGESDDLLRDPPRRVRRDGHTAGGYLGRGGVRPNQYTDAPVPVHRLGNEFADPVEHRTGLCFITGPVRRHRLQARVLTQVVPDQLGHVAVHGFVVGHPVARRVGERYLTCCGDIEHLGADRAAVPVR
jgi:hypothetical protein